MAKLIYDPKSGKMYGAWIFGLHAADLVHEISNAINNEQTLYDLEVYDEGAPDVIGSCGRVVPRRKIGRRYAEPKAFAGSIIGCFCLYFLIKNTITKRLKTTSCPWDGELFFMLPRTATSNISYFCSF